MRYYFELDGGLGDIFFKLFALGEYRMLDRLQPGDSAVITLITTNPFSDELFKWHPKRDQIEVRLLPHWYGHIEHEDQQKRMEYGLPPHSSITRVQKTPDPVNFYPSPTDIEVINSIGNEKYIVLAASASSGPRIFPENIISIIYNVAQGLQVKLVGVGRNYREQRGAPRHEPLIPESQFALNLVDKLSVPGVAKVVHGAAGVICSHSSINLLAWHLDKPVLLLYPPEVFEAHIRPESRSYATFGLDQPMTRHALYQDCTAGFVQDFLQMALNGKNDQ